MMQPEELKGIRIRLRLTQEQMAADLGMSRKAIVEMEAGRAPIEQRTEMAARFIGSLGESNTMYALALKLDRASRKEVVMDDDELGQAAEWLRSIVDLPRHWKRLPDELPSAP